jgi:hypothetical protein
LSTPTQGSRRLRRSVLRQCALQLIRVSGSAPVHKTRWRCQILTKTGVCAVSRVEVFIIPDRNLRHQADELLVNSAIANEADDGCRKMSLTQTASSTAPFFISLREGEDAFLSTSAGGAPGKPILIPSDVDSDTEDSGDDQASGDSDSSLPPARKLRISATRSRIRRVNSMSKSRNRLFSKTKPEPNSCPSKPSQENRQL